MQAHCIASLCVLLIAALLQNEYCINSPPALNFLKHFLILHCSRCQQFRDLISYCPAEAKCIPWLHAILFIAVWAHQFGKSIRRVHNAGA